MDNLQQEIVEEAGLAQYIECIELQLSEIDMLKSMFPDSSEFCIEEEIVKEMNDFVGGSDILPRRPECSIHLAHEKGTVSLYAALPTNYPHEYPDIYVRSNEISRQTQLDLNMQLSMFLDTLEKGDLVLGSAIAWLQERSDEFLSKEVKEDETPATPKQARPIPNFLRLWIYSHHIYSKVKRKDIKDLAEEYQLSGFSLPGKPGIICVEGLSNNANDWWHMVRSWNWQKILCKVQEQKKLEGPADVAKHRRFEGFQELGSSSNIRVKCSGFHVDMGDVFRFLEDNNSGYMFEELFGFSGKSSTSS